MVLTKDTPTLKSKFSIRHSVSWALCMTYLVIGFCAYLYGYYEPFLVRPNSRVRSRLQVYYLALDCWLASLILLKRNGLSGLGRLTETWSQSYRPYRYIFPPGSMVFNLKSLCPRLTWRLGFARFDVTLAVSNAWRDVHKWGVFGEPTEDDR